MNTSNVFLIPDSTYELDNINSKFSAVKQHSSSNLSNTLSKVKSNVKSFRGLLIGILAAFFFALFGILNKKATIFTATEQSSIRYFMQIILMIIIAKYNKESLVGPKEQRKLLLIRGVFGACSFISFGFSIKYIQATDAQALYNVRLVIIPLLSFIFLKEKLKIIHIIGFILTIIGVVSICEKSQLMSLIMTSNQKNCTNQTSQPAFKTGLGFALGLVSGVAASCVAIFL
jgi:drug/metabolite transporter (DMT)-like permease